MMKKDIIKKQKLIQKLKNEFKLKTKLWIRNKICPECRIKAIDCDCDFTCPSCKMLGEYDKEKNIVCINNDCRVRRFFTQ